MRTLILNGYTKLQEHETDNGNFVLNKKDCFGYYNHVFGICRLESFNEDRKYIYDGDKVLDGDIICHKKWFENENIFREAYDKTIKASTKDDEYKAYENVQITWDHRFYCVIKGYDGKTYAVNLHPWFYSNLVAPEFRKEYKENGEPKQIVVPIEEISDDYVFTLSTSFITSTLIDKSYAIKHIQDVITTTENRYINLYGINEWCLRGLRFIAFVQTLIKKGYPNIVISFPTYVKDYFKTYLSAVCDTEDYNSYKFTGHYSETDTGIVICRDDLARRYARNGFLYIDYTKMEKGEYKNFENINVFSPVRKRK